MQETEIIRRVDRAERDAYVALYTAAAAHGAGWLELDGITVVWSARDDDPGFSCVMNLADAPDPGAMLERLEVAVAERGARWIGIDTPPPLAAWATHEELTRRGYVPDYDEFIQVRDVALEIARPPARYDLRIERVLDPAETELFAHTLNVGYDVEAQSARGYVFASSIGMPDWFHYLVWIDGRPAAASVMYLTRGVADLFVATTVPQFRGRGAQSALITARLLDARAAGCDVATSQTIVDNASPRNMARHGFTAAYRRSIYGKRVATE